MKTLCLLTAMLMVATAMADEKAVVPTATIENVRELAAKSKATWVDGKVIKAYVARDGSAVFKAYVVRWNEQEVIVSDTTGLSDLKEGDAIKFLALRMPNPRGGNDVMKFEVSPLVNPKPRIIQPAPAK